MAWAMPSKSAPTSLLSAAPLEFAVRYQPLIASRLVPGNETHIRCVLRSLILLRPAAVATNNEIVVEAEARGAIMENVGCSVILGHGRAVLFRAAAAGNACLYARREHTIRDIKTIILGSTRGRPMMNRLRGGNAVTRSTLRSCSRDDCETPGVMEI